MMHSVSVNRCPSYISQLVQPVNNSSWRQGLRSSGSAKYDVQRTRTKFLSSVHLCGTPHCCLLLDVPGGQLWSIFWPRWRASRRSSPGDCVLADELWSCDTETRQFQTSAGTGFHYRGDFRSLDIIDKRIFSLQTRRHYLTIQNTHWWKKIN